MEQDVLARIKTIPILQVADRLGLKRRYTKAMCFAGHDKNTPSLSFRTTNNSWKCFGACDSGGGSVDLVMGVLRIDFKSALEWFGNEFGLATTSRARGIKRRRALSAIRRPIRLPVAEIENEAKRCADPEVYEWLLSHCAPISDQRGIDYLTSHGIDEATSKKFELRQLTDPDRALARLQDRWGTQRLWLSGLAKQYHGQTRLLWSSYTLLFPFFDSERAIYIQGRQFHRDPKFLNLHGVAKPMFNHDRLSNLGRGALIHICEGIPDAIALESVGLSAVGILGAGSFATQWTVQFLNFDVIVVPDGDGGGQTFLNSITKSFRSFGKAVRSIDIPVGEDAASVIARLRRER